MTEILGYLYNRGGLNNQRQCLGGLFRMARATGHPIFLPEMFNLDYTNKEQLGPISLGKVYELDELYEFADKYSIKIVDRPEGVLLDDPHGRKFFGGNPQFSVPAEFRPDFSLALKPKILKNSSFVKLTQEVFSRLGVDLVLQLRIEKDWIMHASGKDNPANPDDYLVSYARIFSKIKHSFPNISQPIYTVCDEAALPYSKEEIRNVIKFEFGIDVIWKTDILSSAELRAFNALELSIIDFEMAIKANKFVGLTRSSFSNQACWYKFCQTGQNVDSHYIYNFPGEYLSKRNDNGGLADPYAATKVGL